MMSSRLTVWHVGICCVGLLTFLSDHQTYCPANSNITLARGAGPLCSHQLHICCFNNNKHRKKFLIIDQFDVKWHCWESSSTGSGIGLETETDTESWILSSCLVTSSLALCWWSGLSNATNNKRRIHILPRPSSQQQQQHYCNLVTSTQRLRPSIVIMSRADHVAWPGSCSGSDASILPDFLPLFLNFY